MAIDLPDPPRRHGSSLPRWLEWMTAISALVVSVSSIVIAIHNGEIENRMLKASSFPYLVGAASDAKPEGGKRISVDLNNAGVGPAHERSLKIKVAGRYVTSAPDLIAAALGPQDASAARGLLRSARNSAATRFIAANASQFVFRIDRTAANAAYWDKLDSSLDTWAIEYCYCSVFDECWAVRGEDHTPVKACKRDEPHEFNP